MEDDFVIIQVSWETQLVRNYDSTEQKAKTFAYYKALINFLQDNGLTTRTILEKHEPVTQETNIRKSDLTYEGFELFRKKNVAKWIDNIFDKNKSPNDLTSLEKALLKIRS